MGKREIPRNLVWKLTTEHGVAIFTAKQYEVQPKGKTKRAETFITLHLVPSCRTNRVHLENLLGNSGIENISVRRIGRNTFLLNTRASIRSDKDVVQLTEDVFTFVQRRVNRKAKHANGRQQTRTARDRQFVRDDKRAPALSIYT